jgi:hypothetical protein
MSEPVAERQYQGAMHARSRELMSAWMAELGRAEAEGVPTAALMISGNCVELLRASWAMSLSDFLSVLCTTGTMSPSSNATANPTLICSCR